MPLIFTTIVLVALAYWMALGVADVLSVPGEKKKKCSKCKKDEPIQGSDLCYYCEVVVFRQEQKKKREAKAG